MSERLLQVYRVTEVAEWAVSDDGIYEDDAEMMQDVLTAAKQGQLEFEVSDAQFVVMVWDEENRLVVRAVEEMPAGAEPMKEEMYCPECFGRQFLTLSGNICSRGHGGLVGIPKSEVLEKRREAAPAPPPPTRTRSLHQPRKPRQRNSR